MTACSAKLQSLEYVTESAWAEASTDMSSAVRIPTTEQVVIDGLTHEMISPGRVVQYRNDTTKGIPGKMSGSFSFTVFLAGRGATSAGAVSVSALSDLLGWVIGTNAVSSANSDTISGGGSTASSLTTTAANGFSAGSFVRVGAKGDGGGDGQFAIVNTHAANTMSLRTALPAAPAAAAVLYSPDNIYPSESTCALTSKRFQILTADTQWVAHGCWPMSIAFTTPIAGVATAKITVGVSWFEPVSTTFPSAKSVTTFAPSPMAAGSVFFQTQGTATRATLSVRSLTVNYTIGVRPLPALDTVSPYQEFGGCSRIEDTCTVSMVVDAGGASATPTYWTAWLTNAAKHLLIVGSSADAQAWAMYLSNCYWDGNRPTQTEADGLNRLTINLKMGTNTVTTSDLTLSGFRMAVA